MKNKMNIIWWQISKCKHIIAIIMELVLCNEGVLGAGILLLGATHGGSPPGPNAPGNSPDVGKAWKISGLVYIVVSAIVYVTGGIAFPIQIYFFWSWVGSVSAIMRLGCKPNYREVYIHEGEYRCNVILLQMLYIIPSISAPGIPCNPWNPLH